LIISHLFAGEEQSLGFRFDINPSMDERFHGADLRRPGRMYHELLTGHRPNYHVHDGGGGGDDVPVRQRCFTSAPADSNTVNARDDVLTVLYDARKYYMTEACARVEIASLGAHVFELTLASASEKRVARAKRRPLNVVPPVDGTNRGNMNN